jgi:3-oxoadipate enol-lactonase
MKAAVESRTKASDGCAIAFRIDGAERAPALLLSNALGTTLDMWAPQVASLSSHFRVIRYDTRGHGRSEAPQHAYTIDQLGRDAITVLEAAEVTDAHICGLSLGGVTAMWMGIHTPTRVRSLVLAATAARIGSVEFWSSRIHQVRTGGTASIADAVMTRWFTEEFRNTASSVVATYREMLTSTPAAGYIGCCAALRDTDLRPDIARIAAPTLVIAGAADPATPPADGEAVRQTVPGTTMVTLNASHMLNVEQAQAFTERVAEFIAQRMHATEARQIHG